MPHSFDDLEGAQSFDSSKVRQARAEVDALKGSVKELNSLSRDFARSFTGAFQSAIFGGQKLDKVFGKLALSLSKLVLRSALKPLEGVVGSAFSSLFSGLVPFAKGGVVTPFAGGGVLSSPVAFPMRGGVGLAGEAGPEAILPLARGRDGRLGVKAGGGSGGVTINFNVSVSDAESFLRSESQISAMLNRAVSRGNRNL